MLRYLIIVWNQRNGSDVDEVSKIRLRIKASTAGWKTVLDLPGMYVSWIAQEPRLDRAVLLDESRGVVLGTIFRSPRQRPETAPTPMEEMSGHDTELILRSLGRSLIAEFWGYYIAALWYPEDASAIVLRSPVSPLACFHVTRGPLNIFFSNIDDCIEFGITPLSINWDSIAAQLLGGDHLTSESALVGVESVECGECITIKPNGRLKQAYWDPRTFLKDRLPMDFSKATTLLRETTDYCVAALSSGHDRILVNLSGGLDSSIVLSSLCRAPHRPSVTAVNYYSKGSGDERPFARSMARRVDCALVERARNEHLNLSRILDCNRTVAPVLNFSAPDVEARNIALARELNATAIFDGELGDNIFGSNPAPGALVECFRHHGLTREFLRVAVDYAMLNRVSLWRALITTRHEATGARAEPDFCALREMRRLLGEERARSAILASMEVEDRCRAMGDRFLHPWFRESRRIAPGSHALLFGLVTVSSTIYHSPFSQPGDPPRVSPLVSQPLVELALRMPAYLHCGFALDRAVARFAFADVLPKKILHRGLGKGGPTIWAKETIESNVTFLREFLLDGVLMKRNLIDRTKLETALSPGIAKSNVVVGDIFAKLYVEGWLRSWERAGARLQ